MKVVLVLDLPDPYEPDDGEITEEDILDLEDSLVDNGVEE